jgi:hypothetical protein
VRGEQGGAGRGPIAQGGAEVGPAVAEVVEAGDVQVVAHRRAAVHEEVDARAAQQAGDGVGPAEAPVVVVARDRQHAERRAQAGEFRDELGVGVGARRLVDQVAAQEDEVGRLAERGVDPGARTDAVRTNSPWWRSVSQAIRSGARRPGSDGPLAHHVEGVRAHDLGGGRPRRPPRRRRPRG